MGGGLHLSRARTVSGRHLNCEEVVWQERGLPGSQHPLPSRKHQCTAGQEEAPLSECEAESLSNLHFAGFRPEAAWGQPKWHPDHQATRSSLSVQPYKPSASLPVVQPPPPKNISISPSGDHFLLEWNVSLGDALVSWLSSKDIEFEVAYKRLQDSWEVGP